MYYMYVLVTQVNYYFWKTVYSLTW